MNKNKVRPGKVSGGIRRLELACFGMGVLLLAAYAAAQTHAAVGRTQAIKAFRVAQAEARDLEPDAAVDTSLWAANRITAYEDSLKSDLGTPQGLLRIPVIDLQVPIFDGTEEIYLSRGVGHIEDTAKIGDWGNVGIAGHRDGYFRGLKDVKVGDVIEIETLGETLSYRIDDITITDPSDDSVLDNQPESSLTLVTCYPFYFVGHAPQRYIVRAVLQDPASRLSTT